MLKTDPLRMGFAGTTKVMRLFLACAAATGFIFLLAHFNLRLSLLRWLVLFGLCAYDLWVTAPALVDSLF